MTEPLVLIEHLVKSYRRGDQVVEVLRDISLAIPAGAFTALMGPSGSGKSTLLNLIAGIDKPDSGVLRIAGSISPAWARPSWRAGARPTSASFSSFIT
jgi:putative ABC transport system ATP-binding protein